MSTGRQKFTRKELLLFLAPYPLLWLMLGLFVDSAVFTFWMDGQSISSLESMALGLTLIVFSIIYIPAVLLSRAGGESISIKTVIMWASVATFIAYLVSPL
jgi:hypothetical protein